MNDTGLGVGEAIELIDTWLVARNRGQLNPAEKLLISAAWENRKYEDVAEDSGYNADYLRQAGQGLWRTLSLVIGKKVTKTRLRTMIEGKKRELARHQLSKIYSKEPRGELDPPEFVVLGRRPPTVEQYFGYKAELAMLRQSVLERQCVIVVGQAGIGKSSLVSNLLESLKVSVDNHFEKVVWQSMSSHANLDSLLEEIFDCLSLEPYDSTQDLSVHVTKLIAILRRERTLIVLDGIEEIFKGATNDKLYGENDNYGWFFKQMMERSHSSCLLITTREPFKDLAFAETCGQSVRIMDLKGLGQDAYGFLESQGLTDVDDGFRLLIQRYRSNPFLLKLVAARIRSYFGGDVDAFIQCDSILMSESLQQALDTQFKLGIWTSLEKQLMQIMAHNDENSEGIPFQEYLRFSKNKKVIYRCMSLLQR
ncbi:MAG: NACHT domain-containing protein [Acaryochloris sp. RU_4_1]|nr:NACHT domain-containing protein [Acaryochloris sp. RU_4_1]